MIDNAIVNILIFLDKKVIQVDYEQSSIYHQNQISHNIQQSVRQYIYIFDINSSMRLSITALALLIVITLQESFIIDLDLPPTARYNDLASQKHQLIAKFIDYLKTSVYKYQVAFKTASLIHKLRPAWMKQRIGAQFYDQCVSVAKGAALPVSDIIVFNFMYELGAATDFCTAITISTPSLKILGRNLDYGYQQYLTNNSVHLKYVSKGVTLFETLGHAGLIGTHTVLKRSTAEDPHQYAITLNERVQGGLHLTLEEMLNRKCQTSPYALMKAIKYSRGDMTQVERYLREIDTCAAVYWTGISNQGENFVIQKNRGKGAHFVRRSSSEKGTDYIVQTNHDSDVPDPDGRSIAATQKIQKVLRQNNQINSSNIWQILSEAPNFNELTLMTGLIDIVSGEITYKIWDNR